MCLMTFARDYFAQRVQQQALILRRQLGRDGVQQADDGHLIRPDQARVVNVGKHAHQEPVCLLSALALQR